VDKCKKIEVADFKAGGADEKTAQATELLCAVVREIRGKRRTFAVEMDRDGEGETTVMIRLDAIERADAKATGETKPPTVVQQNEGATKPTAPAKSEPKADVTDTTQKQGQASKAK